MDPAIFCDILAHFKQTRQFFARNTILIQANLDLRHSIFPFINQELLELNLKTCRLKKMPHVGEFAS